MTMETLEDRVTAVEAELAELKKRFDQDSLQKTNPWLDYVFGAFKEDPLFEEAVRYGREWRDSQRMEYGEDTNVPA